MIVILVIVRLRIIIIIRIVVQIIVKIIVKIVIKIITKIIIIFSVIISLWGVGTGTGPEGGKRTPLEETGGRVRSLRIILKIEINESKLEKI